MKRILILMTIIAASAAPEAFAACGLSLSANNVTVSWDLNFTYVAVQFSLSKANEPVCDYAIGFGKGGAADYGSRNAQGLKYQLYKDSGQTKILKDVPDVASADNVLMGSFVAGTNLTTNLTYHIGIPYGNATSPTITVPGAYANTFTINVYETSSPPGPADVPVTSGNVTLTVNVAAMIKAALVNTGSAFDESLINRTIDFGNLYQSKSSTFDVSVRTNTTYTITCSSANGGKMVNGASQVPYTFYLDGAAQWTSNGPGATSLSGRAHVVRIVVGNTGNTRAGTHSDTITIEAATP